MVIPSTFAGLAFGTATAVTAAFGAEAGTELAAARPGIVGLELAFAMHIDVAALDTALSAAERGRSTVESNCIVQWDWSPGIVLVDMGLQPFAKEPDFHNFPTLHRHQWK
jgi:hypothetical protein